LYRLVRRKYVVLADGAWHPTKDGFRGGKERRISVDRAKRCGNNPAYTQKDDDPVCRLVVGQVRTIDVGPIMDSKNRKIGKYEVHVEATPLPCNGAHADVFADPEKASERAYKLLREGLAALAVWEEGFGP
jgi:hypothetical protein